MRVPLITHNLLKHLKLICQKIMRILHLVFAYIWTEPLPGHVFKYYFKYIYCYLMIVIIRIYIIMLEIYVLF